MVSALQQALSCQKANHRQANTRKPEQWAVKDRKEKICAFAAFLVPGIKYLMRAAGGREGDSRVRAHDVEGVAAGHVASAVRQQRPMDVGDQLAFSFFFSLKQKPLG